MRPQPSGHTWVRWLTWFDIKRGGFWRKWIINKRHVVLKKREKRNEKKIGLFISFPSQNSTYLYWTNLISTVLQHILVVSTAAHQNKLLTWKHIFTMFCHCSLAWLSSWIRFASTPTVSSVLWVIEEFGFPKLSLHVPFVALESSSRLLLHALQDFAEEGLLSVHVVHSQVSATKQATFGLN